MSEAMESFVTPHEPYFAAVHRAATLIEWPPPRTHDESEWMQWVMAVDCILTRVARSSGAIDVAIGERLDALARGSRAQRLGFSTVGAYARERLGIAASTAQKMARTARRLLERPLLRAAVRAGEISIRRAEAVLSVAVGEAEAAWVERARGEPVRALAAAANGKPLVDEDEGWRLFSMGIPREHREVVDEVMNLREGPFTATTPRFERIEGVCQETLGELGIPDDPDAEGLAFPDEFRKPVEEWVAQKMADWSFLDEVEKVAAPGPRVDLDADARQLDAELRSLVRLRERWDEDFNHLAMIFRRIRGWNLLGFASFGEYCNERLGMAERTVSQRASLEQRLYDLPALRAAMRSRCIAYEKARLLARHVPAAALDEWIARASRMTCIDLRRQLEGHEDRQMCARGVLRVWLPATVRTLFELACRAEREAAAQWLSPGECFGRMCTRFMTIWRKKSWRNTLRNRVLARDRGLCRAPGCSRAADHEHHIDRRSQGGKNEPKNLVSVCAVHHLHCIHMGWMRVSGDAPDKLHWELGVRPGLHPLLEYVTGPDGVPLLVRSADETGGEDGVHDD